jgi:hypothetical protein
MSAWQPIDTLAIDYSGAKFDVWSKKFGRITDCGFGVPTYGAKKNTA